MNLGYRLKIDKFWKGSFELLHIFEIMQLLFKLFLVKLPNCLELLYMLILDSLFIFKTFGWFQHLKEFLILLIIKIHQIFNLFCCLLFFLSLHILIQPHNLKTLLWRHMKNSFRNILLINLWFWSQPHCKSKTRKTLIVYKNYQSLKHIL